MHAAVLGPLSFSVVSKIYRLSTMDGGASTWDGGDSAIMCSDDPCS